MKREIEMEIEIDFAVLLSKTDTLSWMSIDGKIVTIYFRENLKILPPEVPRYLPFSCLEISKWKSRIMIYLSWSFRLPTAVNFI